MKADDFSAMTTSHVQFNATLISALYAEALLLADEARAWFDRALFDRSTDTASDMLMHLADAPAPRQPAANGDDGGLSHGTDIDDGDALFRWAGAHDPSLRIALSCESLRLTTRLMHIIAWLLTQRAIAAGELSGAVASDPAHRLGASPDGDAAMRAQLPERAQQLIGASERLHQRVAQLDAAYDPAAVVPDPVGAMMNQLRSAL